MRLTGRLTNSLIKFGNFSPLRWGDRTGEGTETFGAAGEDFDRREATVFFDDHTGSPPGRLNPTFKEPEFFREPVVIVTPSKGSDKIAAPAAVITNVTKSSFSVSFRNTSDAPGDVGFNWMAVNPGQPPGMKPGEPVPGGIMAPINQPPWQSPGPRLNRGIRLGMLSPNPFVNDLYRWCISNVSLPDSLYESLDSILVTCNNQFVGFGNHIPGVVGIVEAQNLIAFRLYCYNGDFSTGYSNFYWATLGILKPDITDQPDLFIETADSLGDPNDKQEMVTPATIDRKDISLAAHKEIDVAFKTQFPDQPIVLVTPRLSSRILKEISSPEMFDLAKAITPVASVINVSPFGFRMWMTNDNPANYGFADFSWVAFSYPEPVGK
jgi:hypothetical protein